MNKKHKNKTDHQWQSIDQSEKHIHMYEFYADVSQNNKPV